MAQPEDGRPAGSARPAKRQRVFGSRADVGKFLHTLARRAVGDLCVERAAALSFTAVLSLVPALAVSLAFLSVAYGGILTVGPLLMGLALSISGLLLATGERYAGAAFTWSMGWITPILPFLLEIGAFTLLYQMVPNCRVAWRDSLAGGAAAGLLFEGVKRGFAVFIVWFPTYDAIYGALAAFPVLLAWIYLCWLATLVGAELAAALPEWRAQRAGARPG
jgi:uncharacterized BrkB/YihY/UPF0761 family membrane protein